MIKRFNRKALILLLNTIVKAYNQAIISPGEMVGMIAAQSNESPRRVRARLEKRGEMDALQNQIVERKAIDLITEHAKLKDIPLEDRPQDKNHAFDHAISGESKASIPDAKHSEAAEAIEEPTDYT